jgi:hypothetical protein
MGLILAGCAGAGHSHSASAGRSAKSTATATSTANASARSTTATVTSTASARPPDVPRNRAPKHSRPTAPSTDVRIPAMFIIRAGGAVTPPLISVPAKVTIDLQLHNEDAAAHRVTLSVPTFRPVAVTPHETATALLSGVPKGTYRLLVDGAVRARIDVGAVPGP